jgi:hypothetical protein
MNGARLFSRLLAKLPLQKKVVAAIGSSLLLYVTAA